MSNFCPAPHAPPPPPGYRSNVESRHFPTCGIGAQSERAAQLTLTLFAEGGHQHCREPILKIWSQIFPEKELRSLRPNFHFNASVSNLYIPTNDLPNLQEIPILGIYKSLTDTMWKLGLRTCIFTEKEYINEILGAVCSKYLNGDLCSHTGY
jgi:hypothetical protein